MGKFEFLFRCKEFGDQWLPEFGDSESEVALRLEREGLTEVQVKHDTSHSVCMTMADLDAYLQQGLY